MREYRKCTKCLMDTTDKDIVFDENGVCNHCIKGKELLAKVVFTPEQEKENLEKITKKVKDANTKSDYDAILGISGGVDSSYLAYLMKEMGLKVLLLHCDNGWNSKTAVENIKKIVDKTGYDLETYVINWKEFKDLQRSFIKAGVIDIEVLTDHANRAAMFGIAKKHKIKYVVSGANYATEHSMPMSWVWNKRDLMNIKGIHKQFGSVPLKTFPTLGSFEILVYTELGLGLKYIEPLNNIVYRKDEAMEKLHEYFGWEYYGGKHYESMFTKFYQGYILPTKFNADKRKVHLSDLMRNGEITYEEAEAELNLPIYNEVELKRDREFFLKKLGFTEDEFSKIMKEKPHDHDEYPTDKPYIGFVRKIGKIVYKILGIKR